MADQTATLQSWEQERYKFGFVTDIESETLPPGLNEDVVRAISAKKGEPEWMTEWRLKAYRHWLTMREPDWAKIDREPIDFQAISYYSAPKSKDDGPKSRRCSRVWRWTPCSTRCRWRRRSRRRWRRRG